MSNRRRVLRDRPELVAFIEEVGVIFEAQGLPRMAGRVLGALLVADTPEQSAEQLTTTLQASRSSISTTTRLLESAGLIERIGKAGDRKLYYRFRPDAWHQRTLDALGPVRRLRELADKGLALTEDASPEVRQGLLEMHDFYAYWEHELPRMIQAWKDVKARAGAPAPVPRGESS